MLEGILLLGLGMFCWDRLRAHERKDSQQASRAHFRAMLADRNGSMAASRWNRFIEEFDGE